MRELGKGETILALHGGPDFDHRYLLPELDLLADRYRLVCYDQRGRGGSFSGVNPNDVTLDSELADLDLIREWAGGTVTLLGHSWGALLALEYALRQPPHVTRMVLVDPAPVSAAGIVATREHITARRTPRERQRLMELRADPAWQRGELDADAEYYRIHFRVGLTRASDVERVVGRLRQHFTPAAIITARAIEERLYQQTWAQPHYDLLPQLASLRAPTLVVCGEDDMIPHSIPQAIAQTMPAARLRVIAGAGHFPYLERPCHFVDAVFEFMAETA